tara:strand:+ start:153 stop:275 length:123 start_codon:yes stop_codon:yes gene_type:complete
MADDNEPYKEEISKLIDLGKVTILVLGLIGGIGIDQLLSI